MGRLDVRGINENVLENFKESVIEKYGKLHTVMGLEVEKALSLYLEGDSQKANTHTQQKKAQEEEDSEQGPKEKIPGGIMVGTTRAERINNVGEMLMNGTAEITDIGLRRFIVTQGVGDDRVIESYIQTMKLKGWLVTRGRDAGLGVFRSTISKALDIELPREILEEMMAHYEMPQVEGNGGRH